jgi:nucleoside-diphosphate-sugar epimerase
VNPPAPTARAAGAGQQSDTASMARLLVTGANGFIGRHLVAALRERHTVFALARSPSAGPAAAGVRPVVQDLSRPLDRAAMPDAVDTVIHLAQSRHYKAFPDRADDIFAVNVGGTFRLLDYARRAGARCFILASTGGVYGTSYERFVETDPVNPLNFYVSSKYSGELLTASYQPFFDTVVLRFFFVYGPGQTGMLIPRLLRRVLDGQQIVIQGDPGIRVNPIHVRDVVRVFEPAMALDRSEVFNVAGEETVTITELVRLMEQAAGREADVLHVPASSQGDLAGDNRRMKRVLGVHPQVTLIEGLEEMARTFQADEATP